MKNITDNFLKAIILIMLSGIVQKSAAQQPINFKIVKKCILLADQGTNRVAILDLTKKTVIWEWKPSLAIIPQHQKWFSYLSEAKPVYNGEYVLITASGGAVALIRIADKKVMFYAYAGGNTHSAEILPDGNIVAASSTGNFMTVFRVDTLQGPEGVYSKQILLSNGHNVVWDHKRNVLWSASNRHLKSFIYNFDTLRPDLTAKDSIALPETDSHDLFPSYNRRSLLLSNPKGLYRYHFRSKTVKRIPVAYPDIKSVSTGGKGYPMILIYAEDTRKSWSTDQITGLDQAIIFKQSDLKMYKARWFVPNRFSYPASHFIKIFDTTGL
jgi:hypothetical protein